MSDENQNLKVYLNRKPDLSNGVGQVVAAQYRWLPQFGIELVNRADAASVIACHITADDLPSGLQPDVLHNHGCYWTEETSTGKYGKEHSEVNRRIAAAARSALEITVPSQWVAEVFRRDMRIEPRVLGHGVDLQEWTAPDNKRSGDYILWNKNRVDDVCNPEAAIYLAKQGLPVITTFGDSSIMKVTGAVTYEEMKKLVQSANVYLATAPETFGIGTVEALAGGVPVLGYRWAGTADLVEHKVSGYLVEPGDMPGLVQGYHWLLENWGQVSRAAKSAASYYDWRNIIRSYADLYKEIAERKRKVAAAPRKISVIIPSHNYKNYLAGAVESCLAQTRLPDEIIIVDDASTDGTAELTSEFEKYEANWQPGYPRVKFLRNEDNKGVAYSRNRGIRESAGDYIVCLDADDWLEDRFIELCAHELDKNRATGIAYTGLSLELEDGTSGLSNWPPAVCQFEQMAKVTIPPQSCIPSAVMFRREMWLRAGGVRQEHAPGEDTEFYLRGMSVGFEAKKVTPAGLFHYRAHTGSASRTKPYKAINQWLPWMRDDRFPFAAPVSDQAAPPVVRSYANPLVSVIIPVGGDHAKWLPNALDSLLGQSLRSWEAVVVDDTPADGIDWSLPELQPYPFAKANAIKSASHGRGAGYARNLGVKAAKGKLVFFLDADDWIAPDTLEKMVKLHLKSGGKYVYSDWWLVKPSGAAELMNCPEYSQAAWIEKGQHAVSALIDKEQVEAIGGFDEGMPTWEDWEFFAKMAVYGFCGVRLPEPLLHYRLHSGTRREQAKTHGNAMQKLMLERYGDYKKGSKQIMGCCGGGKRAAVAAHQILSEEQMASKQNQKQNPKQAAVAVNKDGKKKMLFTGDGTGGRTWNINGHQYTASASEKEREIDVSPGDVDRLLQTGYFRLVESTTGTGDGELN